MTRVNRRTIGCAVWAGLIAACWLSPVGAAQPAAGDPLQTIPPESLFCIKINNLNATLGQVDQFLTGIAPFGVSMLVQSQFARVLGSPDPNSIDLAGRFAVFGPLPGGESPDLKRIGILVPVSDYRKFVESNPNVTAPDAQGLSRIGPEGQPWLIAAAAGGHALLTSAAGQQALTEMKSWMPRGTTSLAQRLSAEELKRATGSPVWAYVNMQTVAKTFGPMIQAKIQQAKEGLKQMQQQGGPMAGQTDAMVDMYTGVLDTLMRETQSVSLVLDPGASAIRTALAVAAVPDTDMGKTLSIDSSQQSPPNLLGYLENGAIMNLVATPSPALVRATTLQRVELFAAIAGQTLSQQDVARMKKLATDSAEAFAGPMAMSFSANLQSKPPLRIKYVAALRDSQKLNNVLDQANKMMSEPAFVDLLQKFGMKMRFDLRRKVETYKEVPIDAIHIALEPVDANAPQGQAIAMMFGGGLDLRLAVVNNLFLYSLSAEPQKAIQALIDQAKAGGSAQAPSEVQAAMQLLPETKQAEFFGTYNYARAIQMAMAFMPMPMPQAAVTTQSNIAFAGDIGGGRLLFNAAVPKQHVLELMQIFMQMQQKMQGMQQQDQP